MTNQSQEKEWNEPMKLNVVMSEFPESGKDY